MRYQLYLGLDYGGSLTKGCFRSSDTSAELLEMMPTTVALTQSQLERVTSAPMVNVVSPENRAWIQHEDRMWAVGELAEQFADFTVLNKAKYDHALPKTLAAVWVALEKLGATTKSFDLHLACVLPPNEFKYDKVILQDSLDAAIRKFITPSGTFKGQLKSFHCCPEGMGIAVHYYSAYPKDFDPLAFIMLGYRNASVILAKKAMVTKSIVSTYGYSDCIKQIEASFHIPDTHQLLQTLNEYHQSDRNLDLLSLVQNLVDDQRRAQNLTAVIQNAENEYFFKVSQWLTEIIPENYRWVLSGGTSDFFRPILIAKFNSILCFHVKTSINTSLSIKNRHTDIATLFNHYFGLHHQPNLFLK